MGRFLASPEPPGTMQQGMGCGYIEKQGLPILFETLSKAIPFMQHAKKQKTSIPFEGRWPVNRKEGARIRSIPRKRQEQQQHSDPWRERGGIISDPWREKGGIGGSISCSSFAKLQASPPSPPSQSSYREVGGGPRFGPLKI